jgi:hypothetical protein
VESGKMLNLEMKCLISKWIDSKWDDWKIVPYNEDDVPYRFKLILCGSCDGFSRSVLEKKCYNVVQTVVIMKIKETGELIGGYNQLVGIKKNILQIKIILLKRTKVLFLNLMKINYLGQ